jgi:hypothetical protein
MPAIQLARLRQKSAALAEQYSQPELFLHSLRDLFELYAGRVHRPGQSGEPQSLIQSYNLPKPLLRQIGIELKPVAAQNAPATLALCDLLWEEPYLETRLLAVTLLGHAPLDSIEAILTRVERWTESTGESRLTKSLVQQGLGRVRREQPQRLLNEVKWWLETESLALQSLGLRTLLSLATSPEYDNMPAILHLLTPFVRTTPAAVKPDVLDLLASLASHSPKETAFFLRQNLEALENPDTAWLTRQSLPHFPVDTRDSLRLALRQVR